jgi:hypothetical protein
LSLPHTERPFTVTGWTIAVITARLTVITREVPVISAGTPIIAAKPGGIRAKGEWAQAAAASNDKKTAA